MHADVKQSKFVIYYSELDIILGIILLSLSAFFIHDYLSHALGWIQPSCGYTSMMNFPKKP